MSISIGGDSKSPSWRGGFPYRENDVTSSTGRIFFKYSSYRFNYKKNRYINVFEDISILSFNDCVCVCVLQQ